MVWGTSIPMPFGCIDADAVPALESFGVRNDSDDLYAAQHLGSREMSGLNLSLRPLYLGFPLSRARYSGAIQMLPLFGNLEDAAASTDVDARIRIATLRRCAVKIAVRVAHKIAGRMVPIRRRERHGRFYAARCQTKGVPTARIHVRAAGYATVLSCSIQRSRAIHGNAAQW
jgi:hypothetical protein